MLRSWFEGWAFVLKQFISVIKECLEVKRQKAFINVDSEFDPEYDTPIAPMSDFHWAIYTVCTRYAGELQALSDNVRFPSMHELDADFIGSIDRFVSQLGEIENEEHFLECRYRHFFAWVIYEVLLIRYKKKRAGLRDRIWTKSPNLIVSQSPVIAGPIIITIK